MPMTRAKLEDTGARRNAPDRPVLDASASPVRSVTIFQSATAEVTRTFAVNLKSGENVVQFENLSNDIDAESPRIHGLGDNARVSSICCDLRFVDSPPHNRHKHAKEIQTMQWKRERLEARKAAREAESRVLNEVGRSYSDTNTHHIDTFMDIFRKRKDELVEEILECTNGIASCDEVLLKLRNGHRGDATASVVATIVAKHDSKTELQLTYLVSGASWEPCYDLHASTSDGKTSSAVSLSYCANITQSTGEDWTDALITLTKSQVVNTLWVPKVDPLNVTVKAPSRSLRDSVKNFGGENARGGGIGSRSVLLGSPLVRAIDAHTPLSTRRIMASARRQLLDTVSEDALTENDEDDVADNDNGIENDNDDVKQDCGSLDRSALSLSYRINGPVTLQSDGIPHKYSIINFEFTADLRYVCVPRRTTAAFIEGTIKNMSEYELPAGPMRVFMDDKFITKISLDFIGVNESFDCALGVDNALKVSFQTRSRTAQDHVRSFSESMKTTTRTATITVTNGHTFDVAGLVVCDAVPIGDEDSNIKVTLRKPEGLAQAKDGDVVVVANDRGADAQDVKVRWTKVDNGKGGEKDGMYEWVCAIPAGRKVNLVAEWEIKAPSSVNWEESPQKSPSRSFP